MKTLSSTPLPGNELEDCLKQFRLKLMQIGAVSPVAWAMLWPCMAFLSCKKGHPLHIRPGDFYFVCKGLLKEEYDHRGKIIITRFIKEDDPLFINLKSYQGFLLAIEDCVLLRLSREDYLKLRQAFPVIGLRFDELIDEWYDMLNIRFLILHEIKLNHYQYFLDEFPGVAARIPSKDLAAFLDISESYLRSCK